MKKTACSVAAEQTLYAKFWYEYAEIGWNRIASVAAGKEKTDLLTTARLFAMLNITLADAYIAGWDSKYHYNFWRPYTAVVNTPVKDGGNPNWEPLMPTPPVQDYPSTHSILGNAGATVLTYFFGRQLRLCNHFYLFCHTGCSKKFQKFFKRC